MTNSIKKIPETLQVTAEFYHENLMQWGPALTYLTEERGLKLEILKSKKIGFAPVGSTLVNYLTQQQLVPEILTNESGEDFFQNRIIFPLFKQQQVISFTSRILPQGISIGKHIPVHLHMRSQINFPYNGNALYNKKKYIFTVESPICCLTLAQNKIYAIATLGARGNRAMIETLTSEFKDLRIYFVPDSETYKQGWRGYINLALKLFDRGITNIKMVKLPPRSNKEDVNSFFKLYSVKDFKDVVTMATPLQDSVEFKKHTAERQDKKSYSNSGEILDKSILTAKQVPILDVIGKFVEISGGLGKRESCLCPFHEGDTVPSLKIYPESNSYFCYGCGSGGDVIQFIRAIKQIGFKEAVELLNNWK